MSEGESKGEGEGDKADKMRLGFEGDNEAEREADAGQARWGRAEGGERARHHRQQCDYPSKYRPVNEKLCHVRTPLLLFCA